ncbi:Uu.00g137780.m01.CDS01 [Anthostomella pinea]|uniref:Uu.00g137780.m01.CDS01 n=1 Tax=Anthostomella pinea TaxID=933095 RepID=A0AAI8VPL8_9PEZI|nr:Uu.00g137780.m01.CDS01 [Anthostomella pinea]
MSRLVAVDDPARANSGRRRMQSLLPSAPSKRLILCEDGTWLNSDSGSLKGDVAIPSNITRLSRAIKTQSSDGIPQVTYYHYGVGAGGGVLDKLMGATGAGLAEIVREGYQFLCTNWVRGDEIFIFGFSRGAYTARAIAGLIGDVGLLTKAGLPFLPEIFRDVQHQHDEHYQPRHPDIPFRDKPSAANPEYAETLERKGLTRLHVRIKVIGVFDTVGSLGTPKIGWLQRVGLQSNAMKELSFYDTSLSNCIEHAFQALALDERRYAFQPTLWEKLQGNRTVLRQVWFPGAHANIGGGYDDQQVATLTLAWMMAQCQPFIDFDIDYLLDQWEDAEDFYEKHDQKPRPWSFGRIWDGMAGIYAVGGTKIRDPGRYCVVDPTNGKQTGEPLLNTHEYIHSSVRSRIRLGGPGINDKGPYECKALDDWKLVIEAHADGGKWPDVFWRSRYSPEEGFQRMLPEAPLKPLEVELLQYDPETAEYVLRPSGVRQRRSRRDRDRSRRPPDDWESDRSQRPPYDRERYSSRRPPYD